MIIRIAISALSAIAALSSAPALAWGPEGHRITGAIADANLSGRARANVQLLLGNETLAQAATWPDEMRSDPSPFWQKTANPWHYVTLRHGGAYQPGDAPTEGDAITALGKFSDTVRNPAASIDDRRTALRFIVHIVGDLHQPLHVGNGSDRGGNDVKVMFFDAPSNLHAVWDSGIIDRKGLSYSEYARWLSDAITPRDAVNWWDARPGTWMSESARLRDTIYPADTNLSWSYAYQHTPEVELRLKQAGIRIAAYLDALFGGSPG